MRHHLHPRLVGRFTPPQSVERDRPAAQIDLCSHQPVQPVRIDGKALPQHFRRPRPVRATQVDQPAAQRLLQIQFPAARETPSRGRPRFAPPDAAATLPHAAASGHTVRPDRVLEPDHTRVARTVVALDGGLEAHLPRRHEHRHYSQTEAHPADRRPRWRARATPGNRAVIELRVAGHAEFPPEFEQTVRDGPRADTALLRPGRDQAAVQRHAVENLDQRAFLDFQSFNRVEAVQFLLARCNRRQIPARRGRRAADAVPAVQDATPLENASDGPHRGQGLNLPLLEGLLDGRGAVEAQVAVLTQLAAQLQDEVFDGGIRALRVVRRVRLIGPIDPVEPLPLRVPHPPQDGARTDIEVVSDLAKRTPTTNGCYHVAPPLSVTICLLMRSSGTGKIYGKCRLNCSACTGT